MEKELTYNTALAELQDIVKKMESADISIDELTEKIERAGILINICKEKLTKTEAEVDKIIGEFKINA